MPKTFIKNIFLEIKHSIGRFLSILLIVAIGTAFFAGIKASAPDMKYSADQYFDSYHVQDIQVYSTLGLYDDDVEQIAKLEHVKSVQPTFSIDTLCQREASELVIKVLSYQDNQELNQIRLVDGRMPKNENECLIQAASTTSELYGGFEIGDTIDLYLNDEDELSKTLKNQSFKIVGTCYNPNYLSYELGSSSIGSGKVSSFIYVKDSNILADYYTEIDVAVDGCEQLDSYTDEYFDLVNPVLEDIEALGPEQIDARIQSQQDKLNEAKAKLYDELNKGQAKLDDAQAQINQGQQQINASKQTLLASKAQLDSGWAQYNENKHVYDDLNLVNNALAQIEQGENSLATLQANKEQLQAAIQQLEQLLKTYDSLNFYQLTLQTLNWLIDNGLANEQIIAQRDQIATLVETLANNSKESIQAQIDECNSNIAYIDQTIAQIQEASTKKEELLSQQALLQSAVNELNAAYNELVSGQQQYDNGMAQLLQAQTKLDEARSQYEQGKQELEQTKEDYEKQIADSQKQLDSINGEWIVLDRNSHYSYRDYGACADRMDGIAKVFPVFFFLVAALVCMTTMSRMVDEQRNEIGTLKALGYSKGQIASKYIIYALVAGVIGSILGCSIGMYIFPKVIFTLWNMLYNLETMYFKFQPGLIAMASLSMIGVTLLATIGSIQAELKEVPSKLMRPKAGKAGKKILLERIPFIWNRLPFLQKVTARNIFRYKKRLFMTIVGIAGCSALLVGGFGIYDSISDIVHQQYSIIYQYNASITLNGPNTKDIDEIDGISSYYKEEQMASTANFDGKDMAVTVHIVDDYDKCSKYVRLQDIHSNDVLDLDDNGVIISEKMASKMNLSKGDTLTFKDNNDKEISCKVSGVYKNYVDHHIYVTRDMYQSWNSKANTNYVCLLKTKSQTNKFEKKLGNDLMKLDNVKSVTFYSNLEDNFKDIISQLSMVVVLLVGCAAALAFVVLYNLSNVNISERVREIATIKVLGFLPNEVSAYVNRESTLLTVIGALIGLVFGIGLHHLIMNLAEMDTIMFGRTIKPISFVISFLITMVFNFIINFVMRFKLKKVEMVESLKAVE
ncbi:FtsX-like permease family protein [Floccifex sp.]|uniref:FtsX-like permease family protein n=1 Tax=Floccifex sp. TaxID=2815810 RepID=UPI002A7479A5|nr:FtsX-like permease family protein [Floccifex sp.]MDD7280650.1 ABC transporter permease [Erysipelotrichaceae bacterium]MDY2958023.1 FtsX-like permease family protein [Floccifex sp.]